ncbi:MAG: ATP-binding protein, partial [Anaerolineales bacterium]
VLDSQTRQPVAALLGYADLDSNPLMQAVTNNLVGLAGGAGEGFLLDDRGLIIYHSNPERLLQPFSLETSGVPLRSSLAGASAYQDKAPDGTRRLLLYYPVPSHPWNVVVIVPNEVVLGMANEISRPIIVILLLIGLIGLLLVSLIANRVTRPAEALALAAQRISDGQLDQPVVVAGEDEVGRAGLAFERMRQRLRARLEELGLLLRVSQGVASSLDLNDALPPILDGALNTTGAAGVRIVLLPNEEPQLGATSMHQTFMTGPAAALMAPLDRGVIELTRTEGRAIIENLARARAVLDVAPVVGKLHALLALPLRQENTYYGALWLGYDQPHIFTDAEVNFLTTLAGQAAVATANARLFEAAEQGRQRLAAILASTPDSVIVTDRNGRVLLLNPAAEAAFELTGKVVVGKPVADVLPHPELARLLQDNQNEASTGEFEIASGRTLYASASTIISADGSVLGRVCVLRDVTHFKEVDLMKSEFVATVSHDLRAPLTFMRGYATMLPMVGSLNDKQREFGEKIITGIEQMTELIDDLLDLGRIEAGVGLSREACQIEQIVNGVVDTLRPQAVNKGLSLTVEAQPQLPPVSGDPTLLRQAISNLVDNAIKYTPSGGQVGLRVASDLSKLLLVVSDTGLGIAPADQAHLFEKFFRVKQRGSSQVKGSGLGLAIVKSIVERHGGKIWVDSKLGKGSTFYVELPRNGKA